MTQAFQTVGQARGSRWLLTCDHATNRVPDWVNGGDMGIARADMARHIAYDVGAAGVTRALAALMRAPAILSDFSRLVIDPNRAEDDPTLIMRLYDGTVIGCNSDMTQTQRDLRIGRLYRAYHDACARLADARADRVICAIHSFVPQLQGRAPRPWQVGVLYSHRDARLAEAVRDACRDQGWVTGDNQPYRGHLEGDSIDRHALAHNRPNVLIELRNDLIATAQGQRDWAARLAPVLQAALARTGL